MPFCPKCRYEYKADVMLCPDCNVALVDHLEVQQTAAVRPDDSWVVVGGVQSVIKAEIARGSLDSSNIPSVLMSSAFNNIDGNGLDTNVDSRVEGNIIMVPREYKSEAELILETILGEEFVQLDSR